MGETVSTVEYYVKLLDKRDARIAARIAALEAELADLRAKLDQAVEAFRIIEDMTHLAPDWEDTIDASDLCQSINVIARQFLARLATREKAEAEHD